MPLLPTVVGLLLVSLGVGAPTCAASTDTVSGGQVLAASDRLISNNSKFVLGFFHDPGTNRSESSSGNYSAPDMWYLGIWFSAVPNRTTVWVANSANPVMDDSASPPELAVSDDGDLAVFNRVTKSITWSTHSANGTTNNNNTVAVLLNSGNLVLQDTSNLSESRILWQSFDHPTDTLLPSAKLGRNKVTGLNRRLVSKKSLAGPSPGSYCFEVDPNAPQLILKLCNSSVTYWSSGTWNGRYFSAIPELSGNVPNFQLAFVNSSQEEYLQFNVTIKVVTRNIIDVTGQNKHQVWRDNPQGWVTLYATPKAECDVYGICGPFSVCDYSLRPLCSCMKGFSVRSLEDWEQGDRTDGCVRDTPLNCTSSNTSAASASTSSDKFYSMTSISLPDKGQNMQAARSLAECSEACLNNCSCTAYSYGSQGCVVWQGELLNAKSPQSNDATSVPNGGILYLRLAESDISSTKSSKKGLIIGVVIGASAAVVLLVLALMIWRRKRKNNVQSGGLVVFRYKDLRSASKNFSEKLGEGGFGSVFKGQLRDSTSIAVKRLDGSFQGDKQFRAEVNSIGIIQHINLVKLAGFCCDGDSRFLVYEHMPNRSLDIHLFQSSGTLLNWGTRYHIALGVARGLSYLHEGCRDCIIHCDIKPQNILLDASFLPKMADFGMAKLMGRDFSRVLTTMRGTLGYLAPEWISGTPITPKVDVYSYGMVLLELVSGRRNTDAEYTTTDGNHVVYFPVEASKKLLEGDVMSLLDQRLGGDANFEEVERVCKVACWCIQDDEADRPTMGQVVQILEGVLDPEMPPLPRLLETIFLGRPRSANTSVVTEAD